jgi:hypothetical protein
MVGKQKDWRENTDIHYPPRHMADHVGLMQLTRLGDKMDRIAQIAYDHRGIPAAEKYVFYMSQRAWVPRWKANYPREDERIKAVEELLGMNRLTEDAREINKWLKSLKWLESGINGRDLARMICCDLTLKS